MTTDIKKSTRAPEAASFRADVDLTAELHALDINGRLGNRTGTSGRHAASTLGIVDTLGGGRNASLAAATTEPSRQLTTYFGPPNRYAPTFGARTPDKTIITLRESYEDKNLFLSSTVDKLQRTLDTWVTQFVLPWVHSQEIDIGWSSVEVQNTLLDINPELAPPRYLSVKTSARSATLGRRSLGFIMEHGFWKTEAGKFNYLLMVGGIAQATLNTITIMVLREFMRTESAYEMFLRTTEQRTTATAEDCLRITRDQFGAAQKDPYFMQRMIQYSSNLMLKDGGGLEPTDFIVPADLKMYIMSNTDDKMSGKLPEYSAAFQAVGDTFTFMKKRIHGVVGMQIDGSADDVNPLKRVRQVGDYARISDYHRIKDFETSDRDTEIMNMDTALGTMSKITWREAVNNSARFAASGELHKRHASIATDASYWRNFPDLPAKYRDLFLVQNPNAGATGVAPLRPVQMWGEMERWALSEAAIRNSAGTMVKRLTTVQGVTAEEAEQDIREGLELIRKMSNPDLSSPLVQMWFTAVIEGAVEKIPDLLRNAASYAFDELPSGREVVPDLPIVIRRDDGKMTISTSKGSQILSLDLYALVEATRAEGVATFGGFIRDLALNSETNFYGNPTGGQTDAEDLAYTIAQLKEKNAIVYFPNDPASAASAILKALGYNTQSAIYATKYTELSRLSGNLQALRGVNPSLTFASIDSVDSIIPYGYGSWPGMLAIASLPDAGNNPNGIEPEIVAKAKSYVRVVKAMFETVRNKLVAKNHPAINPGSCPPWFSEVIAATEFAFNRSPEMALYDDACTTFAQSFLDRSHNLPAYTQVRIKNNVGDAKSSAVYIAEAIALVTTVPFKNAQSKLYFQHNPATGDQNVASVRETIASAHTADTLLDTADLGAGVRDLIKNGIQYAIANAKPYADRFFRYVQTHTDSRVALSQQPWVVELTQELSNASLGAGTGFMFDVLQNSGRLLGNYINDVIVYLASKSATPNDIDFAKLGRFLNFVVEQIERKDTFVLSPQTLDTAIRYNMLDNATGSGPDYNNVAVEGLALLNTRLIVSADSFAHFNTYGRGATNVLIPARSYKTTPGLVQRAAVVPPVRNAGGRSGAFGSASATVPRQAPTSGPYASEDAPFYGFSARTSHQRADIAGISQGSRHTVRNYMKQSVRANANLARGEKRKVDRGQAVLESVEAARLLKQVQDREDRERKRVATGRDTIPALQGLSDADLLDADSPFTVTYGEDASGGVALNKTMIENYQFALDESRDILAVAMQLIIFSTVDANCFNQWADNDVLVPVDILLLRPYCRYVTISAVACKGGNGLGNVVYSNESFEVGDEVKTKTHIGHYSVYLGVILKNVKNFMVWWDVKVSQYLSGEGVGFYSPDKFKPSDVSATIKNAHVRPSIFAVMCPYGSLNKEPALYADPRNNNALTYVPGVNKMQFSILGYYRPQQFARLAAVPKSSLPHYPSAIYADACYGWSRLNETSGGSGSAKGRASAYNPAYNEIVYQTYQRVANNKTGELTAYIMPQSVFPIYMYGDGKKSVRLGEVTASSFVDAINADTENKEFTRVA